MVMSGTKVEKTKHTVLVVGARGYVGRECVKVFQSIFSVLPTSSVRAEGTMLLNLEDAKQFDPSFLEEGDFVIFLAAISEPDACEKFYEKARRINVENTTVLISKFLRRRARVVFCSSDTVYGEQAHPFDESARCEPVGAYARMKREVECHFGDESNFKSLRLSYIFSEEDKFFRYLAHCTKSGEVADVYPELARSIISRKDVVDGVSSLLNNWNHFPQPIINFGGREVLTRLDYARIVKEAYCPALQYRLVDPPSGFFLIRPKNIYMHSPILREMLGRPQKALREFLLDAQNASRGECVYA